MPFCTQCGHANREDSRFCSNCGSSLRTGGGTDSTSTISLQGLDPGGDPGAEAPEQVLTPADQAAVDGLPADCGLLVVRRGPNSGSRFLLDADVTSAGRDPESEIFLDDVTVSRRHAEFVRTGSDFSVRDVGSLNGTYVNRERIDGAVLAGGDEVQIGKYRLVFYPAPRADAGGQGSRT